MGGQWGPGRRMITYVNAKQCSSIAKGVFEKPDGRFALNPQALFAFASAKDGLMPGISVRYIEVRPNCMAPATVKEMANANRVYSFWEVERDLAEGKMFNNMSLQPLV